MSRAPRSKRCDEFTRRRRGSDGPVPWILADSLVSTAQQPSVPRSSTSADPEIFENEFYKAVLGTSDSLAQRNAFNTVRGMIPAAAVTSVAQIQKHEKDHVEFLLANGATNVLNLNADSFDFTGNRGNATPGPFLRATAELPFLLLVAQAAEDTGVRA